ncbi:hypothetical protein [Candidatus Pollutiaquabacter sp.]|uniref:hypothetical protein n=1 Tax=Candidatus Pollutiaquabacter sp. TaxID=3416354 RepID=UPI003C833B20|nr:hypothetical protein [Bacteroidota bacterium]
MESIFKEIITDYKAIFTILVTVTYAVAVKYVFDLQRKRRVERNEIFFKALTTGLENNAISSYEDITNIYEGITRTSIDNSDFKYGLKRWLKEYLVALISKSLDSKPDDTKINDWKEKITGFIRKNEEISPYDDIPPAEKNLLIDILAYDDKGDKDAVRRKVDELSGLIKSKNEVLTNIQNTNKYSTILAIVGLILTIFFGILSIK